MTTRDETISDVFSQHKALTVCHLAGLSARLGREVQWDLITEPIVAGVGAISMLSRPYRDGFEI
ncbi:MAG: hypothetical protein AAF664_00760 [Planctomycetota bacterium]